MSKIYFTLIRSILRGMDMCDKKERGCEQKLRNFQQRTFNPYDIRKREKYSYIFLKNILTSAYRETRHLKQHKT